MIHMNDGKNGGAHCNDCDRRECSAGVVTNRKNIRLISPAFKCPGWIPPRKEYGLQIEVQELKMTKRDLRK